MEKYVKRTQKDYRHYIKSLKAEDVKKMGDVSFKATSPLLLFKKASLLQII